MTDPVTLAFVLCGVLTAGCWILSLLTANYSQVDRIWSLAPPLYVCLFAADAGFVDTRLNLMAAVTLLWGVRLTYNFARKGGYRRDGEDYRWPVLRARLRPWQFQLMNATFIAPFQNLLLLLIALPASVAWHGRGSPLNSLDYAAAAAFLVFLTGETVADQQQWRFQAAKRRRQERGAPADPEFVTTGLFRYSRHPNFFCEQAMWWTFYVFAVAASGSWLNPSIAGAVLLTLLFQGSTRLTEQLTLAKYPAYAAYQRATSRLIPWRPAR
jgi:steroid 5-alpha reductase family enzyme